MNYKQMSKETLIQLIEVREARPKEMKVVKAEDCNIFLDSVCIFATCPRCESEDFCVPVVVRTDGKARPEQSDHQVSCGECGEEFLLEIRERVYPNAF